MIAMGCFHRPHAKAPKGAFVFVLAFVAGWVAPLLGISGRAGLA
ncbi:hypothetical protein C8C98_3504 [Acidovorax sp. 106]|nr:hypothetical protein C8C98_3504 [Acidovorax sp. 106]